MDEQASADRQAGTIGMATSPRLLVLSDTPFNAETRLAAQREPITPAPAFYKRNHFAIPTISAADWRLTIGGTVEHPATLSYDELRALPSHSLVVTLECAGNGRTGIQPPVAGEPWGYGAVSTAEWTGVRLAGLLETAGLAPATREIVFTGADTGPEPNVEEAVTYVRSLPLATAAHPDTLLAYAMNGEILAPEHGFPVRLIVPGWYGMASVKWVTQIVASEQPFRGFFQVDRYILPDPTCDGQEAIPLALMAVRSVIAEPIDGAHLSIGTQTVRGFAWSGAAPIAGVEISVDDGRVWVPAELSSETGPYAWRRWEYSWHAETVGPARVKSRATDALGNVQPDAPVWNPLGYANNAIQTIQITVT